MATFVIATSFMFDSLDRKWVTALRTAGHDVVDWDENWASHNPDCMFVLNKFGHMTDSMVISVGVAKDMGMRLFALESWGKGNGIGWHHTQALKDELTKITGLQYTASPIDTFPGVHTGFESLWLSEFLPEPGPLRSKIISTVSECLHG